MRRTIQRTLTALVLEALLPLLAGDELAEVLTLNLERGHVVDEHARACRLLRLPGRGGAPQRAPVRADALLRAVQELTA